MNLTNTGMLIQNQSQKQKLILTPDMRESLEVLQMPLTELQKKVEELVMENPVLEMDEGYHFAETPMGIGADCGSGGKPNDEFADYKLFNRHSDSSTYTGKDDYDPFLFLTEAVSFTQLLLNQLSELKISPETAKICRYIIGNLDERGYLSIDVPEVADTLRLPTEEAENALKIVQQMEPAGVGARSLRECLTLQLLRQPDCPPALLQIVHQCIELLAENKVQEIARRANISTPLAQEYCCRIRRLNPVPSSGFHTHAEELFVIPEAIVKADDTGRLIVEQNNQPLFGLSINNYYLTLAGQTNDPATAQYLKAKIKRAATFIQELTFRKKTITRVLEKIIEMQPDYFQQGKTFLRPMAIQDIAQELELNESTISRAIQNKYILCRYGTVSIRSLFTGKVKSATQDEVFSSLFVKHKISDLITNENKSKPLSDQNICDYLSLTGMIVSRRTVAKYRDEMKIPAASKRRYLGSHPYSLAI